MTSEKVEFKRVGSPKVLAKISPDSFTVEITLNGNPNSTWQECFIQPTNYKPNEAHPSRANVFMNKITFCSLKSNIKTNVEWMDKYIQQANDCYNQKNVEQLAFQNKGFEQERKQQEELNRINESLKDL
jgi:hypothetical protein